MACRTELVKLDRERGELERRGVRIVAVSFEPIEDLRRLRVTEDLGIALATDPDRALGRALGLVHARAFGDHDAFFPTKILIDRGNRVLWALAEDDLRVRAGPAALIEAVDRELR